VFLKEKIMKAKNLTYLSGLLAVLFLSSAMVQAEDTVQPEGDAALQNNIYWYCKLKSPIKEDIEYIDNLFLKEYKLKRLEDDKADKDNNGLYVFAWQETDNKMSRLMTLQANITVPGKDAGGYDNPGADQLGYIENIVAEQKYCRKSKIPLISRTTAAVDKWSMSRDTATRTGKDDWTLTINRDSGTAVFSADTKMYKLECVSFNEALQEPKNTVGNGPCDK
jgi:hypothetical protein